MNLIRSPLNFHSPRSSQIYGLNRRTVCKVALLSLSASACALGAPAFSGTGSFVSIEEFGGGARPGLDNGNALRRALNAAAASGATVLLGPGTYEFSSAKLLQEGAIKRPSGVDLQGSGPDRTVVQITGRSVINQLFDAGGASNILTRGIRFVGNGLGDDQAPYAGALMAAILQSNAKTGMTGIFFETCVIDNFASAAWLLFENQSSRYAIQQVGSRGCDWISRARTAPSPGAITVPGHFIYFYGYRGPIENVVVDDGTMDAMHLKGGVGIIGDVDGGIIHIRRLLNAGRGLAHLPANRDGPGAYAVLLYRKPSSAPRNLNVVIEWLENAFSVGIYSAGARASRFHIGHAFGQRDTRDATLLKGVLVLLGGHDIQARIDHVEDSSRVVMISVDTGNNLAGDADDMNVHVHLANVSSRRGARDITIDAVGPGLVGGVRITGVRSGPAAVGVHLRTGPGVVLQNIDLSGLVSAGAQEPTLIGPGNVNLDRIALPR